MKARLALACLAGLPLVAFVAVVGLACYAWAVAGHWPVYARPDPKDLPDCVWLPIWPWIVAGAVASVVLYPPLAAVSLARAKLSARLWLREHGIGLAVFCLGVGLWAIETSVRGERGLLSWLLD